MIDSWWSAHEFEFVLQAVIYGALIIGCAVWWFGASLSAAWRERAKKKRDGLL